MKIANANTSKSALKPGGQSFTQIAKPRPTASRYRLACGLGNQALQKIFFQPKLRVSDPNDSYEQEADQVADRVMRMTEPIPYQQVPLSKSTSVLPLNSIQRACSECEKEEEHTVHRKKILDASSSDTGTASVANVINGVGQPLSPHIREFMESRFNTSFGDVRIHSDPQASRSAREINALAYTSGSHIVFQSGSYNSSSESGKRLLAHELTHVVQQRGETQGTPVVRRAFSPMVMRTPVFSSTLEICHRLLESRVFHVSEGGLRVTARAAYERRGTPACSEADYHITLNQQGYIFDSEYGTCDFRQGELFSRQWTNLPVGDYSLTIWTNNTNPYCCLVGDIVVEQDSSLEGESCTRPPPGPLEILHTALDVAGLVPALGAIPDAINTGIYLVEGDWVNAGLSAVAIIPIFGDAASVGRIGAREIVRISGEGIERVGREGIEAGLREARAAERTTAGTARRVDPHIDDMVERGIIEESTSTSVPTRRPRPAAPAVRGRAAAAREAFDRVRDGYARRLGVGPGGQVHHAIELQTLDRYPGVFSADELNNFVNMRGITPELVRRQQLHGSAIRRTLDRHYRQLDREIAERGLVPGTPAYNRYVRDYLESARDEIDHVYGQFFSESRMTRIAD